MGRMKLTVDVDTARAVASDYPDPTQTAVAENKRTDVVPAKI